MFSNGVLEYGGFIFRHVVPLVQHQFHTYLRPRSFSSRACLWHRILLGCRPTVETYLSGAQYTADFANLVMSHAQLICEQALARTAFIVFARRSKVQAAYLLFKKKRCETQICPHKRGARSVPLCGGNNPKKLLTAIVTPHELCASSSAYGRTTLTRNCLEHTHTHFLHLSLLPVAEFAQELHMASHTCS